QAPLRSRRESLCGVWLGVGVPGAQARRAQHLPGRSRRQDRQGVHGRQAGRPQRRGARGARRLAEALMPYLRRFFLVPPDFEHGLAADLWSAGTLGVRSETAPDGRALLEAWFAPDAPPFEVDWPGAEMTAEETVPDTDWLADYRERAQPFPVAQTLFVD